MIGYKNKFLKTLTCIISLIIGVSHSYAQCADAGFDQTICEGGSTTIGGSPTACGGLSPYTYVWSPVTGLSSNTIANPIASPVTTTTYTVTVTDGSASVTTDVITVFVNPLPTVTPLLSPTVCDGATVSATSFSSTPGGATFNWTNSNPSIGIGSSGIGNVPSFTATNTGATLIGGTISVTATLAGCVGPTINYTITVKPTPVATATPASPSICSGTGTGISLSSTVAGTNYSWASSMASAITGESATGVGSSINDILNCTGTSTGYVNYATTPTAAGCVGLTINTGVNIYPLPNITAFPSVYPVTCSGGLISVSFNSGIAGTTYTWTTSVTNLSGSTPSGSGNISDFLSTITASPGSITYVVTPTANTCSGTPLSYPITINPAPDATFTLASTACQNTPDIAPTFLGGATAGTFSAIPAGLIFSNIALGIIDLTASTPGTYTITNSIGASGGCASTSYNSGLTINSYLDPTINDTIPVCVSSASFNFTSATTGGIWSGNGITNTSAGTFNPAVAGVGTDTIIYTTPGPCINSDTTYITVTIADTYGHVTYSGGNLNSGVNTAVLFNYVPAFLTFDSAQVSPIDASGIFHFTAVPSGNYLVKIFADTLIYPTLVPTFYGNKFLWDASTILTHGCNNDSANVTMVEGIVLGGPGLISGHVSEGIGFTRTPGDPVPGIDVKVGKNPGGQMITNTQTNATGDYSFSNIPINLPGEFYTVYIDIPGLARDSVYDIVVSASTFSFPGLNYVADSNSVYPVPLSGLSISNHDVISDSQLEVYPNPTGANTTIAYELKTNALVTLDVHDLLGKKIQSIVNANQQAGNYKVNLAKLNAGTYFIRLSINSNSTTTRLVVID